MTTDRGRPHPSRFARIVFIALMFCAAAGIVGAWATRQEAWHALHRDLGRRVTVASEAVSTITLGPIVLLTLGVLIITVAPPLLLMMPLLIMWAPRADDCDGDTWLAARTRLLQMFF